ncbi:MAG: hypothetical protein M0038_09975 [Pseudomonadota bacterium]|jgi:hypothetical protein|nr:hypothetical protein [Pseudomonadota bacterium]
MHKPPHPGEILADTVLEAEAHDKWFREQVEQALKEADDPNTEWGPHEVVKADMAKQRTALLNRIKDTHK